MTDQKTINRITDRLGGKSIKIYERSSEDSYVRPGFVVDIPDDPRIHMWRYTVSREDAYAEALDWARQMATSKGFPIIDRVEL